MRKLAVILSACAALAGLADQKYDVAAYVWPAYQPEPRWAELGIFNKGIGEWQNVQEAVSKWEGHHQPLEPLWGYGNEADPKEVERKIDAATAAGVNVFIYDWYWYGKRPFLENALNEGFLKARNCEKMKFFIMWANHHVNKLWDNRVADKQWANPIWRSWVDEDEFKVLSKRWIDQYFTRPNYYRIEGKPVLMIYEIGTFIDGVGGLDKAVRSIAYLREACVKAGLGGLHLMACDYGVSAAQVKALGIDSATIYNFVHWSSPNGNPDYADWAAKGARRFDAAKASLGLKAYFAHASVGWDTNPRYPKDSVQATAVDSTPEKFETVLRRAKDWCDANTPAGMPRLITVNSWNEWTEGSYLEPDTRFGLGYLDAIRRVFDPAAVSMFAPETWFHIIDGNASKEGIVADLDAIAAAGIGGIQLFHGGWQGDKLWQGVKEPIPCLSAKWEDLIGFTAEACAKRGLTFKMQNCPGWSMSGGPWITPDKAMRTLVAFEPGHEPAWERDQDYHEIGTVTFPCDEVIPAVKADGLVAVTNAAERVLTFPAPVAAQAVYVPNPRALNQDWTYLPRTRLTVMCDGETALALDYPQGNWQDFDIGMTFALDGVRTGRVWKIAFAAPHPVDTRKSDIHLVAGRLLDNWEAKAGWSLRGFAMSADAKPVRCRGTKTLVFGHVNARVKNGPAPKEGTGWECDKMDPRGFEANWKGYLGKLVGGPLGGGKLKGTLVDSWECNRQTWTWKMEEAFEKMNGYRLRPWMPALFGYVLKSEAETEKFLLDWRRTCSRLVEDNYFGAIAKIAHANGMMVQFESAFGDVIPGDILRYWKYADEPMCEFWNPHDDAKGFIGSYDFKPVLPCASAAHIYGKRRVSAESFTSFNLTWNENFQELKKNVEHHFARGITHIVFHTYTHNPVVTGKTVVTSFGTGIGTPFLRVQPWWKYMGEFTKYLENCCRELERGLPVIDILRYLGDDLNHKPLETTELFDNEYKYDYCNNDALMTRVEVKDGRLVLPNGMSYRVLWIPKGTFLLPETEAKIAALAKKGARVIRGDFKPDWTSPIREIGLSGHNRLWYQRRDGDTDVFFLVEPEGSQFFHWNRKAKTVFAFNPVTGAVKDVEKEIMKAKCHHETETLSPDLKPCADYPAEATERTYAGAFAWEGKGEVQLNLGKVCHWATVKVNGKEAARLWCEPYSCDITKFLKKGENKVEVEVTSTIRNRLIIDAAKPEAERSTWSICGPKAGSPLVDAGLYGPVTLKIVK